MEEVLLLFSRSFMSNSFQLHGLHTVRQASLSFTISQSLLKLMSIESMMPSNHLSPPYPAFIFPESGSFPMSQLFSSGGQGIGASASTSVLPMNIQGQFPEQSFYVCSVDQSCLTFCGPMDCNLLGSSAHGIFQARIPEWIAISFSRESSQPRNRTHISSIGRWILYH